MKSTKHSILTSALTMLVCLCMFVGSTFAWFSDSVTSSNNIIQSGTLDLEMYWTDNLDTGTWYNVEDAATNTVFSYDNWEPGYTDVRYIKIKNVGNLALNYQLAIEPQGKVGKLSEVINVYFANEGINIQTREDLNQLGTLGFLNHVMNGGATASGTLLPASQQSPLHDSGEIIVTMAMSMITSAGNEYQDETIGDGFTIKALATQASYEKDSFDELYDNDAELPESLKGDSASGTVTSENGVVTQPLTLKGKGVTAYVPAGVLLEDGVTQLELTVTPLKSTTSDITVVNNEVLIPVDVHIEGISQNNTTPIIIDLGEVLPKYLNMGNYHLYHVEGNNNNEMALVDTKEELNAHNQYTYDLNTGAVTLAMATFSEVALVADTAKPWEGKFDYTWYDASKTELTIANADQLAAFGAIVGGMNGKTQDSFAGQTVKLISDINLGDKESENNPDLIFYPIGYYNSTGSYEKTSGGSVTSSVSSFEGTFDGNGHTISNFYQNTWEMFGDYNDGYSGTPNYYKDAMGLFGYVYGGTVKNLTVDNFSSDGEYTPTGVIAAYVDGESTFENIAITNCNPRVYNTGNGGIIGIAGDTSDANDDHITLKNITVDNSNKISALWGSWDVACGGLVGMYRGNVDGNGNATGDTISFVNCHVSAQIDVYNDVCANYQYYAYRYSGMIIGSVRHNTKNTEGKTIPNMTGISATGCTVNYGDWNDYYYCEFEKNTMASYSEDYQFSRVDKSEIVFAENGEVTGCTHTHTDAEDKKAVYLPFHQLFTGYSWGVSSIGLKEYSGIVTDLDITEGDQQESVEKFETKFTGDFLYRVGNQNTVSLGSLFAAKEGATINNSGVVASVEKVDENMNASGTFTANTTDWTKGTIQFSGTGVVKVTIQDYSFCTPTVLTVEVVDAVNATTATSATQNNVVLLNDCGFSSLEVSGGYSLYGNGFTMTCGSDSPALDMGYSFVTLNNGTLDNVQIVCPNFDYAALYKSNLISSGNRKETTDKTRYYNAKSAVMVSGNSQILNSRISGGRAAVNVSGGNVVIDNSRVELGAVASILVGSANSLTLRDVTLVQEPTASTYDPNKTLMGFSVLFVCDADGNATPVTLEGNFVQNAWVDENDKQFVPSEGQSIISTVLGKTEYLHDLNGDGTKESLNLGFAYMPESLTSKVNTTTITDNRTNKGLVPYDYAEVSILSGKTYVYSYKNTNGTDDSFKTESEYNPNKYSDDVTVSYSDTADGLTTGKSFGTDGWTYELNVDLDKLSGYALDFNKLSMSVNGRTVTDYKVNGNAKPTSPVAVTAGGTTYTLTATIDGKEYVATYKVTGTETSKESPKQISGPTAIGFGVAKSHGGDWSGAADVLTGVKIKYWSVAQNKYIDFDFSNFTVPGNAGKLNGTNNYWEYTHTNNDFTLKVTNTVAIHSGKSVYGMPILGTDGKLYFTISSTNGYVGSGTTSRDITMQYEFIDNNGGEKLTFTHTFNISYNKDKQYSYTDLSRSGKLTILEPSCITPDTLITLANGTQKRIDMLNLDDKVIAWDFFKGDYVEKDISILVNHGKALHDVIYTKYSDGTTLKLIGEHGVFDYDLNKFVYITASNVKDYVGHRFVKQNLKGGYKTVVMTDGFVKREYEEAWSISSEVTSNAFASGLLTVAPPEDFYNWIEMNGKLQYDVNKFNKDVEKYGLYSYDVFKDYVTYDQFLAWNGAYLKIPVEKGYFDFEYILELINLYKIWMK